MKNLINEIMSYINTNHPVIYLESLYELDADEVIIELAKKTKRKIIEYSHGYVFDVNDKLQRKQLSEAKIEAFLDNRLKNNDKKRLIVIKDIHRYISDGNSQEHTDVVFRLKNLIYKLMRLKEDESSMIIVAPIIAIPHEIASFVSVFTVKPPNENDIAKIIDDFLRDYTSVSCIDEAVKQEVISKLKGLSKYEIIQILGLAYQDDGRIDGTDFQLISGEKSRMVKKSGILEIVELKENSTSLAGLHNLRKYIERKGKIYDRLAEAKKQNVEPPKGVLLVGLPGCGKTLSAKVAASIMKVPLLRLDMGKLLGKYVGESEENMRKAIALSEAVSPCVLWIDEIEKAFVGVNGDSGGSDVSKRMFGAFLTWMQEKEKPVFVFATANDITSLPPELLRKGRFDEIFSVGLPNQKEREEIFKVHLKKVKNNTVFDLKRLSEKTEKFIGAEIESVVKEALENAFLDSSTITTESLLQLIDKMTPMAISQKSKIEEYEKKIRELQVQSASNFD